MNKPKSGSSKQGNIVIIVFDVYSVVTRFWAQQSSLRFPVGARDFCLLEKVQTLSVAHSAFYSVGAGAFLG
jgi:hypothetical protein